MEKIDQETDKMVSAYGYADTIAALARHAHERGATTLFRRLNKIYEWLKNP